MRGFLQYRVIQNAPDNIEVLLVRNGGESTVPAQVKSTISGVLGPSLSVQVREVDEIPLNRRGKLRKIVRAFPA